MRYLLILIQLAFLPAFLRADDSVNYLRDIKPVLKERCFSCHGALQQKAKLRLDTAALIRQGGRHGAAIQPANPSNSLLLERVCEPEESKRMPPLGKPLTPQQIARLKVWIQQGAPAPTNEKPEEDPRRHWAFRQPVRPLVPNVPHPSWVQNPIDVFLAVEHAKQGLIPAPPTDRATLLRRVYLDLTGLPPSRQELQQFLSDTSPNAYQKVVDRLLDSPQYAERWARHWMDVWRYSDWYGRRAVPDVMNSYPQIWRWRDWIVRSLAEDKGYDRMIQEMLAADEIAPEDDANIVATGFLVRNWFKWNYNQWMRDNVEHTAKAFLGLTLNCCHCHDHKYDPIKQEEYFQFRAFFEPLELRHDRWAGDPDPGPFQKYVYGAAYGPIKGGMIRIFDEKLDAQTFMYAGGDERNRIPGRSPVIPAAPMFLGGDQLRIEPITLPPTVVYPGLKSFVQREELAKRKAACHAAEAGLVAARNALEQARAMLDARVIEAESALERGQTSHTSSASLQLLQQERLAAWRARDARQLAVRAAQARIEAALADLVGVQARIAADEAKYGIGSGKPEELARVASHAERQAAHAAAYALVATREQAIAEAEAKPFTDPKRAAGLKAAQTGLATAQAALQKAEADLKLTTNTYTPLSPVYPATSTGRRKALAGWIANRQNPLTARVAVNHVWSWHFGKPLVESTFNFGRSGKLPTHPELLDWLAVEFMNNGWHFKPLHRLIVMSHAYQMQSHTPSQDNANLRIDPDNRLLWHFPTLRMEAEEVRDSILFAADELDLKMGGPEIAHEQGLTSHRRSLYFAHHGEGKMEFLELFDGASANECYRRTTSVLPQQALALSNSELTLRQGRVLARKLWSDWHGKPDAEPGFVQAAFEQVLSRPPTPAEKEATASFLGRQQALFQSVKLENAGADGPSTDSAMRARENLVIALFNHNDFVTVR